MRYTIRSTHGQRACPSGTICKRSTTDCTLYSSERSPVRILRLRRAPHPHRNRQLQHNANPEDRGCKLQRTGRFENPPWMGCLWALLGCECKAEFFKPVLLGPPVSRSLLFHASDKAVRPLRPRDDERALAILERETNGQRYEMGPLWRYDSVNLPYNQKAFKRDAFLKQKMAKYSKIANDENRTNVAKFLPTLHHRTERSEPVRPTEVGDIVVVACNNCWPK